MFEPNTVKRYLVLVEGRTKGRYFTMHNDQIEDQGEEIDDDVHKRIKSEGFSPGKVDQHIKDQLQHHLKHVADKVTEYIHKNKFHHLEGIILGGHQEFLNRMREHLPKEFQQKVIGDFITDVDSSVHDLSLKAKAIIHHIEGS